MHFELCTILASQDHQVQVIINEIVRLNSFCDFDHSSVYNYTDPQVVPICHHYGLLPQNLKLILKLFLAAIVNKE